MSHGSDEGDNYWPGYVDALTSMVQVLAFVMMMLALAVFSLSQSASKHAVEVIAKAVNADVKPNDNIKQMTQAVMDRLRRLKSADSTTEASKPPEISAETPRVPADAANDPRSEKIVGMRFSGQRSRDNQTPVQ